MESIMMETRQDLLDCLHDLKGKEFSPFPWQVRLFEALAGGEIPSAIDVPTGLGKTSVLDMWLLAHLLGKPDKRPPMRLVYVVNRRTIVDQATEAARRLQDHFTPCEKDSSGRCIKVNPHPLWKEKFDEHVLAVSALRGALADNRQWLAQPGTPAIIIGTVDMIGSRLLFGAYRAGRWSSAQHAGLIGQDSLIVHDEAHLSGPFQKLLDWVAERQKTDASARPVRILPMSATRSDHTQQGGRPIVIDDDDRRVEAVTDRLDAVKRLRIFRDEGKLADRIVGRATALAEAKKRVLIYVIKPDLAGKIAAALRKSLGTDDQRVELLTGTLRGYERDRLTGRSVYQALANSSPVAQSVYLVSTSAGEVGADLDAEHLITDLSTIDAMIQRFGRVNRKGHGQADIDLFIDTKESARKGPLDERRQATLKLLESLAKSDQGWHSASPATVRQLVEHADWRNAASPEPEWVQPHDAMLDAWSLTSIHDPWPVATPLDPYLHGLEDKEAETHLAWRAELDELAGVPGIDDEAYCRHVERVLEFYPLKPLELLRADPDDVGQFLHKLRDRENLRIAIVGSRQVGLLKLEDLRDAKAIAGAVRYSTVILPCSAGGLAKSGLLDDSEKEPARDVADLPAGVSEQGTSEGNADRRRVIVRRNEDGYFTAKVIGGDAIESSSDWTEWTVARKELGELLGLEPFDKIVINKDGNRMDLVLLFRKPRDGREATRERVTVDRHNGAVKDAAERTLKLLNAVHGAPLLTAASHHDLGKKDPRWQKAIGNSDLKNPLAKSFGKAFGSRTLGGYRHEFGSLRRVLSGLNGTPEEEKDLILHLIATHHGRGRPHFVAEATTDFDNAALPDELQPAAIARRFDRLQRRFGHWGLAWLEAIFMAADAEGSQSPDDPEDEAEENDHG
jgi:CRISPR-associated endonuclease/helicase Cas3